MHIFFDSSAFIKRYINESGTETVINWCNRATALSLSGIALPEIISAFCRLHREKNISAEQYRKLKTTLLADLEDIAVCDLTPRVLHQAIVSLEKNVLRGMDAIHIGSAVMLKVDQFVSADQRQCEAAVQAGLQVVMV